MRLRSILAAAGVLVLACCVGYAASVSVQAPFSVNVVSPSAVPAPASAAGFTNLVFSADFTSPAFSNVSTWLDCAGASSPVFWLGGVGTSNVTPCSVISVGTDQGQQAAILSYLSSYGTNKPQLESASSFPVYPGPPGGKTFPTFVYIEEKFRVSVNAGTGVTSAFWYYNNGPGVEYDVIETYNSPSFSDSCEHNWAPGGNQSGPCNWFGAVPNFPGWDPTNYHTYGMLITGNGTSAPWYCTYIDNVQQGCSQTDVLASQYGGENDLMLISAVGGSNTTIQKYSRFMRVWSCPNYPSYCYGTPVTGP